MMRTMSSVSMLRSSMNAIYTTSGLVEKRSSRLVAR